MNQQERQYFFQQIIGQHQGILFKVARVYCPDEDDRKDLIQEIMIQIWLSVHKYNQQFKMSTFIYRISLNVAISHYRKNKKTSSLYAPLDEQTATIPVLGSDDEHGGNNGGNSEETQQRLDLLEQFIQELKEIDKALMLLYLEDKSHAEIADITGLSISNVGTKINRIKEKLRVRFSQQKIS